MNETATTELAVAGQNGSAPMPRSQTRPNRIGFPTALMPETFEDLVRYADMYGKAEMFGVKTAQQAFVVLCLGLELGLAPAAAFSNIHVIENKPSISADLAVALCKSRPEICKYFVCIETTADRATFETQRVGDPIPQSITYTIDQAKQAGLLQKKNWQQDTPGMLRKRAARKLAITVYPEVTMGLYDRDEILDGEVITGEFVQPAKRTLSPDEQAIFANPEQHIAEARAADPDGSKAAAAAAAEIVRPKASVEPPSDALAVSQEIHSLCVELGGGTKAGGQAVHREFVAAHKPANNAALVVMLRDEKARRAVHASAAQEPDDTLDETGDGDPFTD